MEIQPHSILETRHIVPKSLDVQQTKSLQGASSVHSLLQEATEDGQGGGLSSCLEGNGLGTGFRCVQHGSSCKAAYACRPVHELSLAKDRRQVPMDSWQCAMHQPLPSGMAEPWLRYILLSAAACTEQLNPRLHRRCSRPA